jgi:hypothetical protein
MSSASKRAWSSSKGDHAIDIGFALLAEHLHLLGDAGSDEDDFAIGLEFLEITGDRRHRRKIARDLVFELRERGFDV